MAFHMRDHASSLLLSREEPLFISYHSWTSLYSVWWSVAGWLSHPSASSNRVSCFFAGCGGNFWKLLTQDRRQLKSFSNTPGSSDQAFSAVHLPLKQWVLQRRCTTCPFSIQKVSCVRCKRLGRTRSWPIVDERHTNCCLHSSETIHFLLGTLMLIGKKS